MLVVAYALSAINHKSFEYRVRSDDSVSYLECSHARRCRTFLHHLIITTSEVVRYSCIVKDNTVTTGANEGEDASSA